jgi:hypothetical protein
VTSENRRAFLKKIARGMAYSAPVIASFAAPAELVGQGESSAHKPMGSAAATTSTPSEPELGGPPPWREPPPGARGGQSRDREPFR